MIKNVADVKEFIKHNLDYIDNKVLIEFDITTLPLQDVILFCLYVVYNNLSCYHYRKNKTISSDEYRMKYTPKSDSDRVYMLFMDYDEYIKCKFDDIENVCEKLALYNAELHPKRYEKYRVLFDYKIIPDLLKKDI